VFRRYFYSGRDTEAALIQLLLLWLLLEPGKTIKLNRMKPVAVVTLIFALGMFNSCSKNSASDNQPQPGSPAPANYRLTYGDSIFYIQSQPIYPTHSRSGTYSAFPTNLRIDPASGMITLSETSNDGETVQTGLRYRIYFNGNDGLKDSTTIVIRGVNYQDRIYKRTTDNYVMPIVDAKAGLPGTGTFQSKTSRFKITSDGRIDIQQTLNDGFFDDLPSNAKYEKAKVRYTPAGSSISTDLEILLYYYTDISQVPNNVSNVMRAHQQLLVGVPSVDIPITTFADDLNVESKGVAAHKPRPPCIIILGQ
jgi:hypothetical protein